MMELLGNMMESQNTNYFEKNENTSLACRWAEHLILWSRPASMEDMQHL